MEHCVFCDIAGGHTNRKIEYENKNAVVFRSSRPVCEFHFLAIPKTHISNFMELGPADAGILVDMVSALQEVVKRNNLSKAYRLAVNGGSYIQVKHLHIHLLAGKVFFKNDIRDLTKTVL